MPRPRRKKRTRARTRSRRAPRVARPAPPSEAETRLLSLAREIAAVPASAGIAAALRVLAEAHAPEAPLPRALAQAWLRSRGDKTKALALAWAREQVRLALEEIIAREPDRGALGGNADARAWVLLAAVEAIAQEPPEAAADRLRTLLELTASG
jgi:hypothetical protein